LERFKTARSLGLSALGLLGVLQLLVIAPQEKSITKVPKYGCPHSQTRLVPSGRRSKRFFFLLAPELIGCLFLQLSLALAWPHGFTVISGLSLHTHGIAEEFALSRANVTEKT
jgi:hypothetical protein